MNNSEKITAVLTVDGKVLQKNDDGTYTPLIRHLPVKPIGNVLKA